MTASFNFLCEIIERHGLLPWSWSDMTEEEWPAYRDAFWKIARAYFELGEAVGSVKATKFLAHFANVYGVRRQGGAPKKPTTMDPAKYARLPRGEKELATKDPAEQQRQQRRRREPNKEAETRAEMLKKREVVVLLGLFSGLTEDEIKRALQVHPADRAIIEEWKAS